MLCRQKSFLIEPLQYLPYTGVMYAQYLAVPRKCFAVHPGSKIDMLLACCARVLLWLLSRAVPGRTWRCHQ